MADRHPDEIVNDAIDLDPTERASFIERACGGNAALREEVEALLELHDRFPGHLQLPSSLSETFGADRIGPYAIEGVLGRGGMGVVYLAADPRLKRRVALKSLPGRLAADPLRRALFEREAQLLAALNHPNIATIYTLEEADGWTFLTMEYVPGETLAARLAPGRMGLDETLRITRQVARALEGAHAHGIVHRDLKPMNIMITPREQVKVLDFGLAESLSDRPEARASGVDATRVIAGTPGYMSPEQLRGRNVTRRADVWAFGCILFECLTGRPAFEIPNGEATAGGWFDRPPDWRLLPEDLPEGLRGLLAQCLERSPRLRLGRIRTIRREIDQVATGRSLFARRAAGRSEVDPRTGNLPAAVDRLIGRQFEKSEARKLLEAGRLLTLTGAGGCGKTRLALEVARGLGAEFPDGIWLVEFAALSDASLVESTVADALGIPGRADRTVAESLAGFLSSGRVLLLLDNCEHLVAACRDLAERLFRSCPDLHILATSREPLRAGGEAVYRVPSLSVPEPENDHDLAKVGCAEAVRLFLERARSIRPDFQLTERDAPDLSDICRRLDGIPLAIELAAARIGVLPVSEIARRLDDRFRLLDAGRRELLPRQRTLRALIEWSNGLLPESERKVFRRLSIFAGGWSLDAAEEVCAGNGIERWEVLDLLAQLIDKSLAEVDARETERTGQPRYRMAETIRQYAREQLVESREYAGTLRRHREYFLARAEGALPHLFGPDQRVWFLRLRADHGNLRLAQSSCTASETDPAFRLAAAMGHFWMAQGHWAEGRSVCAALLARSKPTPSPRLRALVLHWSANLAECQGDLLTAHSQNEAALEIRRKLGDREEIARSLNNLGNVSQRLGDIARARSLREESLAIQRELGNRLDVAHTLNNLGSLAGAQGRLAEARAFFEESLAIKRDAGDRGAMARSLNNLGSLAAMQEDWDSARGFFDEALAIHRELGDPAGEASVLGNLGELAMRLGDAATAQARQRERLSILERLGNAPGIVETVKEIAAVSGMLDEPARTARLLGAAKMLEERAGERDETVAVDNVAALAPELRRRLGDGGFEREWNRGRRLTPALAIDLALGRKEG
jgi:non-specific serine/threonine protein kinase